MIKAGWERLQPIVPLTPEQISHMLAPLYSFSADLEYAVSLGGGFSNTNARFTV